MLKDFTISYAQNREDIILRAYLSDVKGGFYIDIGANHPEDDSVTKIFYDEGWRGVNIEPNEQLYALLNEYRPDDTNLNIGISDKPTKLTLREYSNHGLSTFSNKMKKSYDSKGSAKTDKFTDVMVRVDTLANVLGRLKVNHIDFMKVDVEGLEYEVLKSNDWDKFRPEIICIEANHLIKDWRPILDNAAYVFTYNDGLNDYYLAKEAAWRNKNFSYPEVMVLSKPIISPGIANIIRQYENLAKDKQYGLTNKELHDELSRTRAQLFQVTNNRNNLYIQLQKYQGIKAQLKTLFFEITERLMFKADQIGRPKRLFNSPKFEQGNKKTAASIKRSIEAYDTKNLSESRLIGGRFRRGLSKSLKFTILSLVRSMKTGMRMLARVYRILKR